MTHPFIQTVAIKDYACIRDASFTLSPLHALIGPNDSGKSMSLRAIRTATQFAAGTLNEGTFDPMLDAERGGTTFTIRFADRLAYRFEAVADPTGDTAEYRESILADDTEVHSERRDAWNRPGPLHHSTERAATLLRERITTATMIRFDPNALRRPGKQLLANEPIRFHSETGEGLSSVLQAINSRDVDAFVGLRDAVRERFPTIQNILVPSIEKGEVVLQARLTDDTVVPAAALSEGLLYFLGFSVLQHLEPSRLFLVEEPENGLHPSRIALVMQALREISKTSQVILATHSPLVVNELEGHEVTVVTRDAHQGTQTVLLKDVPGFDDAMKIYKPGEFWLSYADGESETPLLTGTPRA
jgi:predicted ATPase